ncbi:expressed unknown protein [Seminavis robusta]|uniref:Uncharacterized protein n=1 Tax=Seminavis robusta TaxID=568900 RepID=A0A9N8E7Q3_9STRA|nr:expressed unknown protein [Seminavis robusta]|eukprot:Sro601_g173650.1 n/a (276) ;mRNA; r:53318-54145
MADAPNYAEIDKSGYEELHRGDELIPGEVDPDCVDVPSDCFGNGWCDIRNAKLTESVDMQLGYYRAFPRAFDHSPSDIPPNHPLRAIAKMIDDSEEGSTIRVKCYLLTDFFAIDLLFHYGPYREIRIIVDDAPRVVVEEAAAKEERGERAKKYTANQINKFMYFYRRANSSVLFRHLEFRVADTDHQSNRHCCPHGLSSMHEKVVITSSHTASGSYNLTGYARCKNWESINVFPTHAQQITDFDTEWEALASREISIVYPNTFPDDVPKKRFKVA